MPQEYSTELRDLINRACDGREDPEARERLEERLQEDPAALQGYVEYMDMHATLRWLAAPANSATDPQPVGVVTGSPGGSPEGRNRERFSRFGAAALAASVLLCMASFGLGRYSAAPQATDVASSHNAQGTSGDLAGEAGVARVTGLVDCKWGEEQDRLSFGQAVPSGMSVELEQGLLQFTFNSGAKVIVQGPAQFTPESRMDAELSFGKVSAVVPEMARGYTVTTPTAEIVDLGTEFALDVESDGATEVHVLDGDIVARARQANGELHGEALHARKSDALRFASNTRGVKRMAAEPERFARTITPRLTQEELPPLPITRSLELWLAADQLVTRGESGRVSAWRDICVGDNQVANDACQFIREHQPIWTPGTDSDPPSIRFNGETTRLFTDVISTGNQVSIMVACAPSAYGQNPTRWGGQLVNFGGQAPTIELAVHHTQKVYSGLWASDAVGVELITGEVRSERILAGPRYVLSYVYDMENDRAELCVNGKSQGVVSAPLSPKISGPRTIGGHGYHDYDEAFYRGDIFEVLIYDNALDQDERELLTNYLLDRYEIVP